MVFVISNGNYDIYDLTPEQRTALNNPSLAADVLLGKLLILSSLNSTYTVVGLITLVLSIGFIIAIAVAVNEFVPFT